jgi:hypothetical protein
MILYYTTPTPLSPPPFYKFFTIFLQKFNKEKEGFLEKKKE